MTLSHFSAVLIFAFFASVVFAITQRADPRSMLLFGARCFGLFVFGTIAASWLMYLIKR